MTWTDPMFAVRLIALMFFAAYSVSMGQTPSNQLNGFGQLVAGSVVIFVPALYLLPTYEAWRNKHLDLTGIALVNIFLGWSLLGWVIAMVWAFKKPAVQVSTAYVAPAAPPSSYLDVKPALKQCPFCAEDIMAAAIKCKHCGSELSPAA